MILEFSCPGGAREPISPTQLLVCGMPSMQLCTA